jgi:hypothetical protein
MYADVFLLAIAAVLQVLAGKWNLLPVDCIVASLVLVLGSFLKRFVPRESTGFLFRAVFTFDMSGVPNPTHYIEFILLSIVSIAIFCEALRTLVR